MARLLPASGQGGPANRTSSSVDIYTHTHTRMFVDEISSGRCGCVEPDRCHSTKLSPLITDRLKPVKILIESTGIYGSIEKRETLPDTDD